MNDNPNYKVQCEATVGSIEAEVHQTIVGVAEVAKRNQGVTRVAKGGTPFSLGVIQPMPSGNDISVNNDQKVIQKKFQEIWLLQMNLEF